LNDIQEERGTDILTIKNVRNTKNKFKKVETRDNVKIRLANFIKGMAKNITMKIKNDYCENLSK